MRRKSKRQAAFSFDAENERSDDPAAYQAFAEANPPGTLVEATVRRVDTMSISLRLADGVYARLPTGAYANRFPDRARPELDFFPVPRTLEVVVQSVNPEQFNVHLSLLHYEADRLYCNAEAGYRSNYRIEDGMFSNAYLLHRASRRAIRIRLRHRR